MSEYLEKYDVASEVTGSMFNKALGMTLATSADVVTTLWNSLPLTPEWKTEDILSDISDDALSMYKQSPDTVHTLSILAGSVIPGGVSVKLLNRLRGGLESAGYTTNLIGGTFAGTRQKVLTAEIERVFAEAGAAGNEYKQLKRNLYLSNISKEVMDNAAIELAVVGTLNAHPYMEDYYNSPTDFLKNFAIGAGFGGVIGTAFAVPMTRKAIIDSTGKIATEALSTIVDAGFKDVRAAYTNAGRFQLHTANVRILDDIAGNASFNGLTKEIAASFRLQEAAAAERILDEAAPFLTTKSNYGPQRPEVRAEVAKLLSDERFIGVDKIRYYDLDTSVKETARGVVIEGKTMSALQMIEQGLDKINKEVIQASFVTPDGKAAMVFTRMSTGEIFSSKGVRNAALAVDKKDIKSFLNVHKNETINIVTNPVKDFAEDNLFRSISSATSDAQFLRELKVMKELHIDDVPHITIAPDHLPRMNALISRIADLPQATRDKLQIHIRSDYATFQQGQKYIAATKGPDYLDKIYERINTHKWVNKGLSEKASSLLDAWVHGRGPAAVDPQSAEQRHAIKRSKARVVRLIEHIERGTPIQKNDVEWVEAAKEIMAKGKDVREALRPFADDNGYITLYRGMSTEPTGSSSIQSFTTRRATGIGFAHGREELAKLYDVHVDSIIGSLGSGGLNEAEILVGAATHRVVGHAGEHSKIFTKESTKIIEIEGAGTKNTLNPDQLYDLYADETQRQIRDMRTQGIFSIEEISARLNVKKEAVTSVLAGADLKDLSKNVDFEWRRYTSADKIESEYLHPNNKLFAIVGNVHKNPTAEAFANMDARMGRVKHTQEIEQMTMIMGGEIGPRILEIYKHAGVQMLLDRMLVNIGEINSQLVGNPVWQSADQALRRLISGPVLTALGKNIINANDKLRKELIEPLASVFLPIKNDKASLAEFNGVINKLYSLEGWRDIRRPDVPGNAYIVQRDTKGAEVPVKHDDGSIFWIRNESVIAGLESMRRPSGELLRLHNLNRAITGQAPLNDLGFYVPPISLVGKNYAFVVDNSGQTGTRLLVASTEAELADLIKEFKHINSNKLNSLNIVTKAEQDDFNMIKGYSDYESSVTYANVAFQHKGSSAQAIIPSDPRFLENIITGYQNVMLYGIRKYADTYMHDVTGWLDRLSTFYQQFSKGQPKGAAEKESKGNAALIVKNILLGRDQLESSPILKTVNTFTDMALNRAAQVVNNTFRVQNARPTKETYDQLLTELKDRGVEPIWKSFDEWFATTRADTRNLSADMVSTGNGMLAMLQLRMFEVAQASVNIMSLPILTWSALMDRMPGTVVGPNGESVRFPLRMMMGGIRQMFSSEGRDIEKRLWESAGHIDQTVRQYTETVGALKGASQGGEFVDKGLQMMKDFQNSKAVELLSKPSDMAERLTRRFAMHTGYFAAKQAYPGLDEHGLTIAAVAFTDRAIGNYHAAQRPTVFQGTFGAALGLYQTYFLTYAQHVYRGLEERNFRQLATLAATQAGIFGISSWPGFQVMSEQIVSRFNDQHYDLTTGTFRAADKHVAELILYGLPSSLGPAFYTRGDISPRIPSTAAELAVVNGVKEGYRTIAALISKAGEGLGNGTPVQSLFEALSMQSLNRPIARWSELVTGSSVTRQGNTVSPQNEVWTPLGVTARLLATRPLEEQVVRNARHLDTFYGQVDRERRQDAVKKLKVALRDGKLDDDVLGKTAHDYLRFGGNSKGWNAAVNEAMVTTEEGTRAGMLRKLEPDSPIRHMINDLW